MSRALAEASWRSQRSSRRRWGGSGEERQRDEAQEWKALRSAAEVECESGRRNRGLCSEVTAEESRAARRAAGSGGGRMADSISISLSRSGFWQTSRSRP